MIQLNKFEKEIQEHLSLSDKDSLKMGRLLNDIEVVLGMSSAEILEYLRFGAKEELEILHNDYNWNQFARTIIKKLKPKHD